MLNVYLGIVDSHAGQGGEDVLNGVDHSISFQELGTACRGRNTVGTGYDPGIRADVRPEEPDSETGGSGLHGHPGNLPGMQALAFEYV